MRRVLQTLGAPLPGDTAFNAKNNPYSQPAYDALCREFDVSKTADFRFTDGANQGLVEIYKKIFGEMSLVSDTYDQKTAPL